MRAVFAPSLVAATLAVGAVISVVGCEEKMGVEKRAEDIAKSASAQKAADSASAQQVDPAELKYMERKTSLEKAIKAYRADVVHMLVGGAEAKPGMLRPHFEAGAANDKVVKDLEEKLKKDSKDGIRLIKVVEPMDVKVLAPFDDAEVDVIEQRASKNTNACFEYSETWKYVSDKWVIKQLKTVQKVDCP
jgi:hypothetical protein